MNETGSVVGPCSQVRTEKLLRGLHAWHLPMAVWLLSRYLEEKARLLL